jgi:hypothetical protein
MKSRLKHLFTLITFTISVHLFQRMNSVVGETFRKRSPNQRVNAFSRKIFLTFFFLFFVVFLLNFGYFDYIGIFLGADNGDDASWSSTNYVTARTFPKRRAQNEVHIFKIWKFNICFCCSLINSRPRRHRYRWVTLVGNLIFLKYQNKILTAVTKSQYKISRDGMSLRRIHTPVRPNTTAEANVIVPAASTVVPTLLPIPENDKLRWTCFVDFHPELKVFSAILRITSRVMCRKKRKFIKNIFHPMTMRT